MMIRLASKTTFFMVILLVLVQGCAWVELSEGGKDVVITTAEKVTGCEKLATTTVNTVHKVGFFNRDDYKLRTELNDLARNEATKLAGNALVPVTEPENGSQAFAVYRCP